MKLMSRRPREERGAVLVIACLAMAGLVTVCALGVDISMRKADLRADRGAADAGATAGALSLTGSTGAPAAACADAWQITLRNLDIDPASATSPCTSFPTTSACSPTSPVEAVGTAGGLTIRITIPVTDSSSLMSAHAIGGNQTQTVNTVDGTACQRVGVTIQRTRSSVFAGIAGIAGGPTTVHSVARYNPSGSGATIIPALVALNKTACPTIDSASGTIRVYNAGALPGVIDSDSDGTGSGCSSGTTFRSGGSGSVTADASTTGVPGELGYVAATEAKAFSTTGTFVGTRKKHEPVTRRPVDAVYRCGNVTPLPSGCTTGAGGTDAISNLHARYGTMTAATAPAAGFTVFPGVGQSCNTIPPAFAAGNWYINCANFNVVGPVLFTSGNVVFSGDVTLGSGALLTINAANAATTAPTGTDSTVVVQGTGGITTTSNTWQIRWYRTTVLITSAACQANVANCGTISLQNGIGTWTAPQAGQTKGLIYWSETTDPTTFQGNPTLTWNGVFFAGSSRFDLQGNVTVDASNVQLWVNSVVLNNASARLLLKPDPNTGISTSTAGSSLIR